MLGLAYRECFIHATYDLGTYAKKKKEEMVNRHLTKFYKLWYHLGEFEGTLRHMRYYDSK